MSVKITDIDMKDWKEGNLTRNYSNKTENSHDLFLEDIEKEALCLDENNSEDVYSTNDLIENKTITEATRIQLINKGKKGLSYKDSKKGNRWTSKGNCFIANTVKDYNKIDMNTFWKEDILKFGVKVEGETNNYIVTIEFNHILDRIRSKVNQNNNNLTPEIVYKALFESLSTSDVKISCSCPDFKYRFAYQASKQGYKSGELETREANIMNPDDNLGSACKHILAVLNNVSWLNKVASVIVNYAYYCKDNMEYNYSRFIFPKIYGMSYNKAIQLLNNENDKLDSSEELINLSNAIGRKRGQIKKGSNKNPLSSK